MKYILLHSTDVGLSQIWGIWNLRNRINRMETVSVDFFPELHDFKQVEVLLLL